MPNVGTLLDILKVKDDQGQWIIIPALMGPRGSDGNDGITPTVSVTNISGGHNVSFYYGSGDSRNRNFNIMDGTDGTNGVDGTDGETPLVDVTSISGGHLISFSYGPGDSRNKTFYVMDGTNGTNGTNGTDGITPTVTITPITGGNNVAFYYGSGDSRNKNFNVLNGTNGTNGTDGDDGITPTVTVTTISGGHNVAFSYGAGDPRNTNFDVLDGLPGEVPAAAIAGTQASTTASKALAVGERFWLNGTLYIATSPIASGGMIVTTGSGKNCDLAVIGDDLTSQSKRIDDVNADLNSIYVKKVGRNLFNPAKAVTGAILDDGTISTAGSYANYITSDFIELEPNTNYAVNVYNATSLAVVTGRKLILLYDSSKQPKSGTYQNSTSQTATFESGDTYKYVRVSTATEYLMQVRLVGSANSYVEYTESKELLINLGETPSAQVLKIVKESGILTPVKNLVNEDEMTTGFILDDGTVSSVSSYANYDTSPFIQIEPSTDYVYTSFNANLEVTGNRKAFLMFDEDKNPITLSYQNTTSTVPVVFTTPATAKFIRVSNDKNGKCQLEIGDQGTPYSSYREEMNHYLGSIPLSQIQNTSGNILFGKKWAVCGDSFTAGATDTTIEDGIYAGNKYVYPYLIGNRNNMDIVSHFESGQTLAYPASHDFTNSLTNPSGTKYYQNIPSDIDYITIYLGINDSHHASGDSQIPIGTVSDNTTDTFGGAWNVVLSWLIENRPNAHIGVIVSNGVDSVDYRTLTINICKKYGIPYLDLNGDETAPAMIRTVNPDIDASVKSLLIEKWAVDPDTNTHPNDAAHLFESTCIEAFLRRL